MDKRELNERIDALGDAFDASGYSYLVAAYSADDGKFVADYGVKDDQDLGFIAYMAAVKLDEEAAKAFVRGAAAGADYRFGGLMDAMDEADDMLERFGKGGVDGND